MAAGPASLCSALLVVSVFVFVSAEQETVTATVGKDVTLTCRAPNSDEPVTGVRWSEADLGDQPVLFYHNSSFLPANQHPSFKQRVELRDREMKGGDVSVILKNVTIQDSGTYECRVFTGGTQPWKSISSISLRVYPPEKEVITAEPWSNVTLTCQAPNSTKPIAGVKWRKRELDSRSVLLYHDAQFVPEEQHPSFKNRVELQDRQMKGGDVSVILRNVTAADDGTYECCVLMAGTRSWKYIKVFDLSVGTGHKEGAYSLIGGFIVAALIVARCCCCNNNQNQ